MLNKVRVAMLPETWSELNQKHFEKMINNLDHKGTRRVDVSVLFSYLCLQSSQRPDASSLEAYSSDLNNAANSSGYITMEEFINIRSSFDDTETQYVEYERSNEFDRTRNLKVLLYITNQNTRNKGMNVPNFLSIIDGSIMDSKKDWNTYFELLFL